MSEVAVFQLPRLHGSHHVPVASEGEGWWQAMSRWHGSRPVVATWQGTTPRRNPLVGGAMPGFEPAPGYKVTSGYNVTPWYRTLPSSPSALGAPWQANLAPPAGWAGPQYGDLLRGRMAAYQPFAGTGHRARVLACLPEARWQPAFRPVVVKSSDSGYDVSFPGRVLQWLRVDDGNPRIVRVTRRGTDLVDVVLSPFVADGSSRLTAIQMHELQHTYLAASAAVLSSWSALDAEVVHAMSASARRLRRLRHVPPASTVEPPRQEQGVCARHVVALPICPHAPPRRRAGAQAPGMPQGALAA